MTEIGIAKASDFEDALDFGNYVFGIDFRELLPKLYGEDKSDKMKYHHVAKEDGKIKAMVGCIPIKLRVGNEVLNVGGIGTVSVHPYSRGKGYMKQLMNNAIAASEAALDDMMVLSGYRQRYEFFGFTPCGSIVAFDFTKENMNKCITMIPENLSIIPYESKYLDRCKTLCDKSSISGIRDAEHFEEITRSWNSEIWVVIQENQFAGFLVASQNKQAVNELLLEDATKSIETVLAFMKAYQLENLKIICNPYDIKMVQELSRVAESYHIEVNPSLRIMNYPKVIRSFMQLKHDISPLMEGEWVFEIKDKGTYMIKVTKDNVSVTKTNEAPQASFTDLEAMAYLFSPVGHITHMADSSLLKNWFPVSIYFPSQDNV